MKKFEFSKSYEEVEAGGEVYRIDLSDDKVIAYQKQFRSYQEEILELDKVDTDKLSPDDVLKHFEKMKAIVKKSIDFILGDGAFDKLYKASGNSLMNLMDFVNYLTVIVREHSEESREDKRNKYVKKK